MLHGHWLGRLATLIALVVPALALLANAPLAQSDNTRLNHGVYSNIFTAQKLNGCQTDLRLDGRLTEAARRQSVDVLNNHDLNGDIGSDGSTTQQRAQAAGYTGRVSETIAINPALAISGTQILNTWWYDPVSRGIMQDCRNTAVGIWSENSLDRTVVIAVYGQPIVAP